MTPLSPDDVMAKIAQALPEACRPNVTIIGSLAAGYHFFAGEGQRTIRTKDVDCTASGTAATARITSSFGRAGWRRHCVTVSLTARSGWRLVSAQASAN